MKEKINKATPRELLTIGSGKANIPNARILKLWRFNTAYRLSATGVTSSKPWQSAVLIQGSTNRGYYIANHLAVKGLPASLGSQNAGYSPLWPVTEPKRASLSTTTCTNNYCPVTDVPHR